MAGTFVIVLLALLLSLISSAMIASDDRRSC